MTKTEQITMLRGALKKAQHSLDIIQGLFVSELKWADTMPPPEGETYDDWQQNDTELLKQIAETLAATAQDGDDVPEGWKLAPLEPTEHMLRQAIKSNHELSRVLEVSEWEEFYKALLAAAPEPPKGEQK